MYRDQFIAYLSVNGHQLREDHETVRLPFGTEYSLVMKNLSGKRASVKVEIDGQDALDGTRLIVGPGKSIDLERFIQNGNLHEGRRFKFIQKTERIQEHRGDRADDGIVRVSWQYEAPAPIIQYPQTIIYREVPIIREVPVWPWRPWWKDNVTFTCSTGSATYKDDATLMSYNADQSQVQCRAASLNCTQGAEAEVKTMATLPRAGEGITVGGSVSSQTFTTAHIGTLEPEVHTICLKLLGESPVTGQAIEKPVTVREKLTCPTCGAENRSTHKFCSECGTGIGD